MVENPSFITFLMYTIIPFLLYISVFSYIHINKKRKRSITINNKEMIIASVPERGIALLFDFLYILLSIPIVFIFLLINYNWNLFSSQNRMDFIVTLILAILTLIICFIMSNIKNNTIGYRLQKLKSVKENGKKITIINIILRDFLRGIFVGTGFVQLIYFFGWYSIKPISIIFLLIWLLALIDFFNIAIDEKERRLIDKYLNIIIIKTDKPLISINI